MPYLRRVTADVLPVGTWFWAGLTIALLVGSLLVFQFRHSSIITKATGHQTEPYTELYFSQPRQLPALVNAGQSIPPAFTIHNVEGRAVTYTYDIDFSSPSASRVLSRQQLTLANGQTSIISDAVAKVPAFSGRAEISIVLEHMPEAIHYWVKVGS